MHRRRRTTVREIVLEVFYRLDEFTAPGEHDRGCHSNDDQGRRVAECGHDSTLSLSADGRNAFTVVISHGSRRISDMADQHESTSAKSGVEQGAS
jgi:hypothetical protein